VQGSHLRPGRELVLEEANGAGFSRTG